MEEALVSSLLIQEQQQYNRFFLLNKPVIKYTVRFKDLMVALERLKVNDKHIILSMGVYLGTFIDLYGEHPLFLCIFLLPVSFLYSMLCAFLRGPFVITFFYKILEIFYFRTYAV